KTATRRPCRSRVSLSQSVRVDLPAPSRPEKVISTARLPPHRLGEPWLSLRPRGVRRRGGCCDASPQALPRVATPTRRPERERGGGGPARAQALASPPGRSRAHTP